MNTATILALLQMTLSLLKSAQVPGASVATMQSAITVTENTLQTIAQSQAVIPFSIPKNDSAYPDMRDLMDSAYKDANSAWVQIGTSVQLLDQYTSFGDLNGDGTDDAAVIVSKTETNGQIQYFLVAMLNQNNVMFDIAELPLGTAMPQITNHHIVNGSIVLDNQTYELIGTALVKTSQ